MRKAYIVGYRPSGMNRCQPVLNAAHSPIKSVPVAAVRQDGTRYTNQDHKQTHHVYGMKATGVWVDEYAGVAPPPVVPKG